MSVAAASPAADAERLLNDERLAFFWGNVSY
jgi:hypothetical protein